VINNPSLVRLPEFSGTVNLQQLYVRNNTSLATGPRYPLVAEAGTVLVADNPLLASLTGLSGLQSVRSLDVSRNASLGEVDFGTLASARSVRIVCNAALPESSLDTLRASVSGTVDVWGNQGSPTPCP